MIEKTKEIRDYAGGLEAYGKDVFLSYLSTRDATKLARWLKEYADLLDGPQEPRRTIRQEPERPFVLGE